MKRFGKQNLRRYLASLLLVLMVFQSTGVTQLMEVLAYSQEDWDDEDPNLEIPIIDDRVAGWEQRYQRVQTRSATPSVASPSDYSFEIRQKQSELYEGNDYYFADLAKYVATPSVAEKYKDSFRITVVDVRATDANATYTDSSGQTIFTPQAEDVGLDYDVDYVMEYWSENYQWEEVPDPTDITFTFHILAQIKYNSPYMFEVAAADDILTIGDTYDLKNLADYKTDIPMDAGDEENYRLMITSVEVPVGGSYGDPDGRDPFTPEYTDLDLVYEAEYIIEYTADHGNTWQRVNNSDGSPAGGVVEYTVREEEYTINFADIHDATILAGGTYQFMQESMSLEVSPAPKGGVDFILALYEVDTPGNGTYTWNGTDTSFTPQAGDKTLTYAVHYGIKKIYPDGRSEWVTTKDEHGSSVPVTATSQVQVIGDTLEKEIVDDDARISSLSIGIADGTAPWDGDDSPGNDSEADNKIVRSFDTVYYNLNFVTQTRSGNRYQHGRIYFEAELPFTKNQAAFNTDAMGLMDTDPDYHWVVETDPVTGYQTLKCFYEVGETTDESGTIIQPIPNEGTFPIIVNIYSMSNNDEVAPTFRASVAYVKDGEIKLEGEYDEPIQKTADKVTISAAPSYNVQLKPVSDSYVDATLIYDFNTGNDLAVNKGLGNKFGTLRGYGITLQLYSKNKDKGMKGMEMPSGDITFDLKLTSQFIGHVNQDPKPADIPLVWSFEPNRSGSTQRDGRVLPTGMTNYAAAAAPQNGTRSGEFTEMPSTAVTSCWNGGDWTATQSGDTISITVKDYQINPFWFPHHDVNWQSYIYYALGDKVGHIGCFSAGELYLMVPYGGSTGVDDDAYYPKKYEEPEGSVRITVEDINFKAKSVTGQDNPEIQPNIEDDRNEKSVQVRRTGGFSTRYLYGRSTQRGTEAGMDGIRLGEDRNSGTDAQMIGGKVSIRSHCYNVTNGAYDNVMIAANRLIKFDDKALSIDTSMGVTGVVAGRTTILYGAKPDGTGWTNDAEMNTANEEDLKYYSSLADLEADGLICVGVLAEDRWPEDFEYYGEQGTGYLDVVFDIKPDYSLAGTVVQTVGLWNAWRRPEYKAVVAAYNGTFPSRLDLAPGQLIAIDQATTPTVKNVRKNNYEKAWYDELGFHASNGGEAYYADSLYLTPYQSAVKKNVEQWANTSGTSQKKDYDLANSQIIADYVIKPKLETFYGVELPDNFATTVTITDTIPKGLMYRLDSAVAGGTYVPSSPAGLPGTVTGGTPFAPTKIEYKDDAQILTWVIENHRLSDPLPEIHYSCDIDLDSNAGTNYVNEASIQTSEDQRVPKEEYGNYSTATIVVHAPAMLTAKKEADRLFNEVGSDIGFNLTWTNRAQETYSNRIFMDSMPFYGDAKGSAFTGNYTVSELTVTPPLNKTVDDYTFYYTTDEAAADMIAGDLNPADFTSDTCNSGGVTWIKAAIESDGTVPELYGKAAYGWILLGSLRASETLSAHVSILPTGNAPEDLYINQVSVGDISLNASARTVGRILSGVVWLDKNYNGRRDADEARLGGVKVRLLCQDPAGTWVVASNVHGELCETLTDGDGSYEFSNLPAGDFIVEFSDGTTKMGGYRATTQNAPGVSQSINSDAAGSYNTNGILSSAKITGINLPGVDKITYSPYVLRYQDLGLVTSFIPEKTYNEAKTDLVNGQIVTVGDRIDYKITYGNSETTLACDITITDVLDKGLTVMKNTISDDGQYQPDPTGQTGGTITWTLTDIKPGKVNGMVTFAATVNEKALIPLEVRNKAQLDYHYHNGEDHAYETQELINPLLQIKVVKSSDPVSYTRVKPGQTITYKVKVENIGNATVPYTVVRDYIPAGTSYQSGSVSNTANARGTYVSAGNYVEWVIKNLASGADQEVSFKVTVNDDAPANIKNVALYELKENDPGDPGTNPNDPEHPTNEVEHPTRYEVRVVKDSDPVPGTKVAGGDKITYMLKVENTGDKIVPYTTVRDYIPAGTTYEAGSVSSHQNAAGVYAAAGTYVEWVLTDLQIGETREVSFAVTVNPNPPASIVNAALYEGFETDPGKPGEIPEKPGYPTNEVEHPAVSQLTAVKTSVPVSGTTVKTGETITYTITVSNNGAREALNVYVRDYIPEYTRYLSVQDNGAYQSEGAYVEWLIDRIAPGASASVSFQVRVLSSAVNKTIYNTALYEDDWTSGTSRDPNRKTNTVEHPVKSGGGGGGGGNPPDPTKPTVPPVPTDPTAPTDPTTPTNPGSPLIPYTPGDPIPEGKQVITVIDDDGVPRTYLADIPVPLGLVRTGDSGIVMLFGMGMMISAIGLTIMVVRKKKQKS